MKMSMNDWTPLMNKIYFICFSKPRSVEEIAEMTGESIEDINEAVLQLEKEGNIKNLHHTE